MRARSHWDQFVWCLTVTVLATAELAAASISFNRDVRPILSDRCFSCHGPDEHERKGGLRLDLRESAVAVHDGVAAVVPGHSEQSELVRRIDHGNVDERMPPVDSGRSLSERERKVLRDWIDAGAVYETHWAYATVRRPALPNVTRRANHPIDRFVLSRLEREGLEPGPLASRERLLRRLAFDLTGLPPSLDEIDAFLADTSDSAVDTVVDRLLASERYGEHMAVAWLDAARYADTNGYNNDTPRANWKWREWVIEAFNRNQPFDQFLTEQLAGDLIPDATVTQRVATGFNRNHSITSEGGIIDEEYRLEYVADRVHTTSVVFMGLSLQCARCHEHKFDPVSQKEYYQFFAFFNQVPETGYHHEHVGNPKPVISLATSQQEAELMSLRGALDRVATELKAQDVGEERRKVLEAEKKTAEKALADYEATLPSAMVMRDLEAARETFLLERGAYDRPGETVLPDVPGFLPAFPKGAPRNRLGLAQWLTQREHPLTARVMVNRFWHQLFGRGLVETVEDFGVQGDWPSHPELLDWLAAEFMESGWDTKGLLKQIVQSETYQRSAQVSDDALEKDPENVWMARGPRVRLSAEMIRDNALSLGGLLQHRVGGPSVRPYQPAGLWEEVAVADASYSGGAYQQDHGVDLYRRGVYTWWKRTCPPPAFSTFDAPNREFCSVRRSVTNTPLQALVLLNDPTFVEAARAFAVRMIREGGESPEDWIRFGFRAATSRQATVDEVAVLAQIYDSQRSRYDQDESLAEELLSVGESVVDSNVARAELAALAIVGSVLLNLDETIHR